MKNSLIINRVLSVTPLFTFVIGYLLVGMPYQWIVGVLLYLVSGIWCSGLIIFREYVRSSNIFPVWIKFVLITSLITSFLSVSSLLMIHLISSLSESISLILLFTFIVSTFSVQACLGHVVKRKDEWFSSFLFALPICQIFLPFFLSKLERK